MVLSISGVTLRILLLTRKILVIFAWRLKKTEGAAGGREQPCRPRSSGCSICKSHSFYFNRYKDVYRVRAHASGIPVMLKAENNADGAIFVEAQATTTVANAWDTLFFDFGTPTNGVLNLSNVYDKVTLFYNFVDPTGVGGGEVFYWDDVEFRGGGGSGPGLSQMELPVTFDDPTSRLLIQ